MYSYIDCFLKNLTPTSRYSFFLFKSLPIFFICCLLVTATYYSCTQKYIDLRYHFYN